jgi:choline dehydrogenase-like flavoprotein
VSVDDVLIDPVPGLVRQLVDVHFARGQHHFVRGLYVADGGVFPSSIGGPPQLTIYTAGMKIGRHVAEDLR